jgi:hypothetical protein
MKKTAITAVAMMTLVAAAAMSSAGGGTIKERLNCYAGPSVWGPETRVIAHLGASTYTIDYEAVGSTVVIGQVTYWETKDKQVTKEFNKSITFRTADVAAQPTIRFKGVPTGSAVKVTVK